MFHPPADWGNDETPFIKRVIGEGGDTVDIRDGDVLINGTVIDEPYVYEDDVTASPRTRPPRWTRPSGRSRAASCS